MAFTAPDSLRVDQSQPVPSHIIRDVLRRFCRHAAVAAAASSTMKISMLSHVLDDWLRIPGTPFARLDAIVGLVPGIGDVLGDWHPAS